MRDGEVVALQAEIRREDVLGFLGYPAGRAPPPRVEPLLIEALALARALARPRGVAMRLDVERASEVGLEPIEGADHLVIGLCTAGPAVEDRVASLAAADPTRALLLDAAGSAAAEESADRLSALVVGADEAPSGSVSCRISPGYARWPLSAQREIFERLPAAAVGVELLPSMLMVPRKSISFAMWIGADARPIAGLSGCARCSLIECLYRRAARAPQEAK